MITDNELAKRYIETMSVKEFSKWVDDPIATISDLKWCYKYYRGVDKEKASIVLELILQRLEYLPMRVTDKKIKPRAKK